MLSYRLYFLRNNRLLRWQEIEAEHDLAAIETARRFAGEDSVELWFDKRKITTFAPAPCDAERARAVLQVR